MKLFFTSLFFFLSFGLQAQKKQRKAVESESPGVDSMYVNLYTDSLKKGTYNYINVDGKLSNGRYIPLDSSDVIFISSDEKFYGNSLWIGPDFRKEKVTIKVILRSDPNQCKSFDMYVKKAPDPEIKTEGELLQDMQKKEKKKRNPRI